MCGIGMEMSLPDSEVAAVELSLRTRVPAAPGDSAEDDPDDFIQSLVDARDVGERNNIFSQIRQRGIDFVIGCFQSALTGKLKAFKSKHKDSNEKIFLTLGEALLSQNTILAPYLRTNGSTIPESEGKNILHWAAGSYCPSLVRQILGIIDQQHTNPEDRHRAVSAKSGDDQTALVYAIRKADLETCEILINYDRRLLDETFSTIADTPLHTAIKLFSSRQAEWQNCHDIVALIVKSNPRILCRANRTSTQGSDDSPPYRLAMDTAGNQATQQELEKLRVRLKELLFRHLRDDVEALAKALYKKNGKLLELDLSDFDFLGPTGQRGDFTRFVKTFCNPTPMDGIEFEETLASVELPDMSMAMNQSFDDDVIKLFNALQKVFKVQKIVSLTAWDNPLHPLPDYKIAIIVDAFKVEELRWCKPDLDIDVLRPGAASLRRISLFSNGNWGTLYHWTSLSGLLSFPKLKEVTINIVQNEGSPIHKSLSIQKRVNERFGPRTISFEVTINQLHRLDSAIVTREDKSSSDRFFSVFSSVHTFLDGKHLGVQQPLVVPPIKIAIIDNGFDKWQTTISENIKQGISYASRAGRTLPWFTASHAHGTHMASLMVKINPVCEFFVYRVNSLRGDIDSKKAVKAINAASEANVDIINLSWTFDKTQDGLEDAINKAAITTDDKDGALIFCATSDEPHNTGPIYPADYNNTISVSAANGRGRPRAESRKNVDLMVLGENLAADGPSYFTAPQNLVSGSSVATALASGIASVLLVYAMYASKVEGDWKEFKKRDMMLMLFKHMQPGGEDRYVDPAKLFLQKFQQREEAWKHIFDPRAYDQGQYM